MHRKHPPSSSDHSIFRRLSATERLCRMDAGDSTLIQLVGPLIFPRRTSSLQFEHEPIRRISRSLSESQLYAQRPHIFQLLQ
uniref:Uncharacterized protein n=1 Tax=Parascaris univalens TaxID=6257 RepID=A0A915BCE5_PARUN